MLSQNVTRKPAYIARVAILCLSAAVQPGDPNEGERPVEQVPVDGVEWLLLAGGLWGLRNLAKGKSRIRRHQ